VSLEQQDGLARRIFARTGDPFAMITPRCRELLLSAESKQTNERGCMFGVNCFALPKGAAHQGRRPLATKSSTDNTWIAPVSLSNADARAMTRDQVDLENEVVWIPDSKTPNGIAEVPLTDLGVEAFRDQMQLARNSPYLFPSDDNATGHQITFKTAWRLTLRRARVPYFRIYDLRSTYATRLSAGGVADEWVTPLLRQGDAKVFKKYSQMKLQMKREALQKINRGANERTGVLRQVGR
jgi:integrase